MDNLLVQVCGEKKAVLFAPDDFEYLYIQGKSWSCTRHLKTLNGASRRSFRGCVIMLIVHVSGDKSLILDVDQPDLKKFPLFEKATQYEATLSSGDVLFIPALWFHSMTAVDFGVAVNVFWKNLDTELYDKNDPYGNKDPLPASKALTSVAKAMKDIRTLPSDYQRFYALKMISQIKEAFHLP